MGTEMNIALMLTPQVSSRDIGVNSRSSGRLLLPGSSPTCRSVLCSLKASLQASTGKRAYGSGACSNPKRTSRPLDKRLRTRMGGLWKSLSWDSSWIRLAIPMGSPFVVSGVAGSHDVWLIVGLKLEGATWSGSGLALNDGRAVSLGPSQLVWRKAETSAEVGVSANLPVYLNGDRADVLFGVDLKTEVARDIMAQRGVCLTAA